MYVLDYFLLLKYLFNFEYGLGCTGHPVCQNAVCSETVLCLVSSYIGAVEIVVVVVA